VKSTTPPNRPAPNDRYPTGSRSRSEERGTHPQNVSRSAPPTVDGNRVLPGTTPPKNRTRWGSRSVDIFQKIEQIGEGTYGKVYQAKNTQTGDIVALKKVRMENEKEGFPITAIREIKILKELRHENVVQLKEIVTSRASQENKGKQGIYMVFEYMDHDLTGLMIHEARTWKPSPANIKCYMKQLLNGLYYCHSNNVLHRDIKGSNLLINEQGELKLADFGLARPYTEQQGNYTNRVITLWYRPPELLLGAVQYGPAIDMWSAGCIFAELLVGRAIFPGRNEIDQLELIFKLCGTPNEHNWPDVDKLPWWHMFKPSKEGKRCLAETLLKMTPGNPAVTKEALDLLDRLLTLDPRKRITAADALDAEYFWVPPEPAKLTNFSTDISCHEYQAKKRKPTQQGGPASEPKRQKVHGGANPIPGQPPAPRSQPYPQGGHSHPPYPPAPPRDSSHPPQGSRSQEMERPRGGGYPYSSRPPSSGSYPPSDANNRPPHPHDYHRPSDANNRPPHESHRPHDSYRPPNNPHRPSDSHRGQGPPAPQGGRRPPQP
jgi:cyclin-dependent kinase 12/13